MNELEGNAPFRQLAEENEGAFLRAYSSEDDPAGNPRESSSEEPQTCPFCGAVIREGASYCTACMRPLLERRIIPVRKRRTGKPARMLWTALGILALLSAAVLVFLTVILPAILRKSAPGLPSPAEFRILAAGASEEESRQIWSQEAFSLQKQENGFSVYETESSISVEPLRIAFSEDGKCLFLALRAIPANDSQEAAKLLKTAFSAVYRYYPENLEELLNDETGFSVKKMPDEDFTALLALCGAELSEDAEILESYPIFADRFAKTPAARVYKTFSDGSYSLFVLFESEGT